MTGERYEDQVRAVLHALELRPPRAFLWFGRRETVSAAGAGSALLVAAIARRLEEDFFSTGTPRPRRRGLLAAPDEGGAFVRALSQANAGRGAWQSGWRLSATSDVPSGEPLRVVRSDGLALLAPAAHVRADQPAVAGAPATVLLPKELRAFSPGSYVALGDTPAAPGDDLVGVYWNVAAAGAVTLVARLTYALNAAQLPFALALLDHPARYGRGDAAVLTVARADYAAMIGLLRPLLRALGAHLTDDPPAFTKPLARGLAVAEPPGGAERFGTQRCRLLAEAVVAAGEAGAVTVQERSIVVRDRLAAAGVRLEAPYLRPGSADAYARS